MVEKLKKGQLVVDIYTENQYVIEEQLPPNSNNCRVSGGFTTKILETSRLYDYQTYFKAKKGGAKNSLSENYVSEEELGVGTFNGIGMTLISWGEKFYCVFVLFLLPIIPLGCYNASVRSSFSLSYKNHQMNYTIRGRSKWDIFDVLMIYLTRWAIPIIIIVLVLIF